jgi:uncharacterized membrane protein (DUF4010 family)
VLSLIIGLTDIDPFLLNLFQDKVALNSRFIAAAAFQAMLSNQILKLSYCYFWGSRALFLLVWKPFVVIIMANLLVVLWFLFGY